MIDLILKILVLVALLAIRIYWNAAEEDANVRLPSTTTRRTQFRNRFRIVEVIFFLVLIIQCFIYPILPFEPSMVTRIIGIALFLSGVRLSVEGRRALGENWNHMIDYQVKQKQELVTDGIYKYSRHPIYAGFLLMMSGVEIILHSWLWILVIITVFPFIYLQSKKEEAILARHFHKEYLKYLHTSKMFFPYIF